MSQPTTTYSTTALLRTWLSLFAVCCCNMQENSQAGAGLKIGKKAQGPKIKPVKHPPSEPRGGCGVHIVSSIVLLMYKLPQLLLSRIKKERKYCDTRPGRVVQKEPRFEWMRPDQDRGRFYPGAVYNACMYLFFSSRSHFLSISTSFRGKRADLWMGSSAIFIFIFLSLEQ